jgi:ketosteroid isomerase-like protein
MCVVACDRNENTGGQKKATATPPAFDLEAARTIIAQKNAAFTAAHVAGDVAAIDAMFTRDATSFSPGAAPAHGPAALHALTVDYLKSGVTAFTERTTSLYGDADLLIDQGEYVVTYGPDHTVERGKYLNVWKPEDGTWKIHANIWNTTPANASP